MNPKFNSLLEWWKNGHTDDQVVGYGWEQDTFEEARRIFEADYQQTGGGIYVGIVELSKDIYAVFSEDLIRIIKCGESFKDKFEILGEGVYENIYVVYA